MKKVNEYIKGQSGNDFCLNVKFCAIYKCLILHQKCLLDGKEGSRRPHRLLPLWVKVNLAIFHGTWVSFIYKHEIFSFN